MLLAPCHRLRRLPRPFNAGAPEHTMRVSLAAKMVSVPCTPHDYAPGSPPMIAPCPPPLPLMPFLAALWGRVSLAHTYDGAPGHALFKWGKCQTQSPSFAHGCSSIGLTFHPLTKIQYAQAFNSEEGGGVGGGELSKMRNVHACRKGERLQRKKDGMTEISKAGLTQIL